jgi:hypothetical protein
MKLTGPRRGVPPNIEARLSKINDMGTVEGHCPQQQYFRGRHVLGQVNKWRAGLQKRGKHENFVVMQYAT